jgi:hypothetical protein
MDTRRVIQESLTDKGVPDPRTFFSTPNTGFRCIDRAGNHP